jgi:hypothetical protein
MYRAATRSTRNGTGFDVSGEQGRTLRGELDRDFSTGVAGAETPGGTVTTTATLQPGFAFPTTMPEGWTDNGDGTATYVVDLDDPVCDTVAKLTVPAIQYTVCLNGVPTNPVVTPNVTDGIVFTTSGTPAPGARLS